MKKTRKVIDLFCGTGGFSKGFEKADNENFETVLGIDNQKVAVETFKLNHPAAIGIANDIRSISCQSLTNDYGIHPGDIDVIIGGPPCQGFSSIRPKRSSGYDDPRNTLFEEFRRFVEYFKPARFVFENVVGLATYNDGETMKAIEERFNEIGYFTDWKILNAANYGVPQKRERLVLIGSLTNEITFPAPTHFANEDTIGYRDKRKMVATNDSSLQKAISVMDAISDLPIIEAGQEAKVYDKGPLNEYQLARRKNLAPLSLHSSTKHSDKMLEIIKYSGSNISCIPKHLITSGFSSCYSRLDADKPSTTLTVNFVHPASNRCIHPYRNRALTPREGARIQSYDDDFLFAGSRTQIVKQIGNAVPPLLGKAIAESLFSIENTKRVSSAAQLAFISQ